MTLILTAMSGLCITCCLHHQHFAKSRSNMDSQSHILSTAHGSRGKERFLIRDNAELLSYRPTPRRSLPSQSVKGCNVDLYSIIPSPAPLAVRSGRQWFGSPGCSMRAETSYQNPIRSENQQRAGVTHNGSRVEPLPSLPYSAQAT